MVAELEYQPVACEQSYRMFVASKRLAHDRGQSLWAVTQREEIGDAQVKLSRRNGVQELRAVEGTCHDRGRGHLNATYQWFFMTLVLGSDQNA
jgi:hypothetical protein